MKTVLTYGTFDLLHVGHVNILEQLKELGDRLVVGVSTDEFNHLKGKQSVYSYAERARIVGALRCVDLVIPENDWSQKVSDVQNHLIDIFGIGEDWQGKFDELSNLCEVVYLPRTDSISTTDLKKSLSQIDGDLINKIKHDLDSVLNLVKALE
jgi:glycerol-3-phosphate cytidylyltransferase